MSLGKLERLAVAGQSFGADAEKKTVALRQDEDPAFWVQYPLDDLSCRVAALHRQRREWLENGPVKEVEIARRTVSDFFIRGNGIEVGAGARPFPIPEASKCFYGDIRDADQLNAYFKVDAVSNDGLIDAQTYSEINDDSFDFVISAHVIEHLENPIGSIESAIRVLKPGGVHLLAVPDLRFTFDRRRQPTSLNHLIEDAADGGAGSRINNYIEFLRDVARPEWGNLTPDDQLERVAIEMSERNQDIHFHTWTSETFRVMLDYVCADGSFEIVGHTLVMNENIFVLQKKKNV